MKIQVGGFMMDGHSTSVCFAGRRRAIACRLMVHSPRRWASLRRQRESIVRLYVTVTTPAHNRIRVSNWVLGEMVQGYVFDRGAHWANRKSDAEAERERLSRKVSWRPVLCSTHTFVDPLAVEKRRQIVRSLQSAALRGEVGLIHG
jgi:hypothetical protein